METKDWRELSEIIKNCAQTLVFIGGSFAIWKWIHGRHDRATDILLKLQETFQTLSVAKVVIEEEEKYKEIAPKLGEAVEAGKACGEIDPLLDFYILLHGVRNAKQVPDAVLSPCFCYWLAHYFRDDRIAFRRYVDTFYPTLKRWLREDCKKHGPNGGFFRPHDLFDSKVVDKKLIDGFSSKTKT